MASDLSASLKSEHVRSLLDQNYRKAGLETITLHACDGNWSQFLARRIQHHLDEQAQAADIGHEILSLATVSFDSFLQANVTGPPLSYNPADMILSSSLFEGVNITVERIQRQLVSGLSVDGEAVYRLIPHVELFCLAKCILNHPSMTQDLSLRLARLRVNFWHQRMLSDISSSLQEVIYDDLKLIGDSIFTKSSSSRIITPAQFLLERATIHIHHGFDHRARADIEQAAQERSFHFTLTGRLGKRTKYQEKELSQLVVLAKSADEGEGIARLEESRSMETVMTDLDSAQLTEAVPRKLNLDDDTLLESIAFTQGAASAPTNQEDGQLHSSLEALDPGNQPLLQPLDAIILLATASSVTNTSPTDGLTREETLPYAERVISGGSSNWQVYTQALLVRSRIEGYRSRTIERGVLQLQAVVDQVIAETSSFEPSKDNAASAKSAATTFLPQAKSSESASASERLRYIHQLASPPRWKLESELADRWISLGGLRTALEIYERLQMWAEVALCWAANEREDKARKIIRRQLYNSVITTSTNKLLEDDQDNDVGDYRIERDPLPPDAPRLFCILGDLENSTAAYERAWEVSNQRYARAQRSLGKHYSKNGELSKAGTAYARSLKVNPQNHATWFALGCIKLEQENWTGSVDAFGRAVQIEDTDAESWSNLAVALLRLAPDTSPGEPNAIDVKPDKASSNVGKLEDDRNGSNLPATDPQKHVREAFAALKRAASLKRDSFRIWQNLLSVSVKLSPPPYTDVIVAQNRLIELLGNVEGERCVDVEIVEALVAHLVTAYPSAPPGVDVSENNDRLPEDGHTIEASAPKRVGFERMVIDLVHHKVTPLITSSRRLWLVTAKLSLYLHRPSATLSAYEKAWRVTMNQPGWESGTEEAKNAWKDVMDSTIDLLDGYESLGERTREAGMSVGELVAKDWRFKARSAARSVLARAKEGWEGDDGYETLSERLQELKSI